MLSSQAKQHILSGKLDDEIKRLYVCGEDGAAAQRQRLSGAIDSFCELYGDGRDIAIYSAPGRTEVCGNHTDHQLGRVLAASVNLDAVAIVSKNDENRARVKSRGFRMDDIGCDELDIVDGEKNKSISLLRGVCARFKQLGHEISGFDAYTTSDVLSGSGLSSSAAYEVLIGTAINGLFNCGESALSIAQIGQYAENVYFGKPSGLMDQAASSVGGFIEIDFRNKNNPSVRKVGFDFANSGYALCIIDVKGSHSDLTPDYAAVPAEMRKVAAFFGKDVLSQVSEDDFYLRLPEARKQAGDRAILRAMHFFSDDARSALEWDALQKGDFTEFLRLVRESGHSSMACLQNIYSSSHPQEQGASLTLALCERFLKPCGGAWRMHGGGFGGTVQCFVPEDELATFKSRIEAVNGPGSCHMLSIRPVGGVRLL